MKVVFADTWFFEALLSEQDAPHSNVLAYLDEHDDFIITTRWLLVETANAASRSAFRNDAARFLQAAEIDASLTIAAGSDDPYFEGLKLYLHVPTSTGL